ncbi:MAG: hypothetical protein P9M03_12820 [Candidatus Theseobacter exili]|nr:hypothetical protein [Candidatus Theseobacter exili]
MTNNEQRIEDIMDDKIENKPNSSLHLKKIEHDSIEDISADKLMANVRKSIMPKGIIFSTIFHVVFIAMLSLGFIKLCFEYKTMDPRTIIADAAEAKEEAVKLQKREEAQQVAIEKAKIEATQQQTNITQQTTELTADGKSVPKVLKDINEVSDERPVKSSLDSLDDDF